MDGAGGSPARPRIRIGDREQDGCFAILREHYAAGRLSLDEVRRRTEIVVAATYADEADSALAELPAIAVTAPEVSGGQDRPQRRSLFSRRGHAEVAQPAA